MRVRREADLFQPVRRPRDAGRGASQSAEQKTECFRRRRHAGNARTKVGAAGDTLAGRVAGREYTNAELLGFLNAYNDAEVEVGQLAETKAADPQVRAFARRIVGEHRALKTEVTNAARERNLTPTMPKADEDLQEDHREGMRDRNGKAKRKEFDEAFLEHEIKMHKKVLDEVEDALGRNRNPEIRSVLERARGPPGAPQDGPGTGEEVPRLTRVPFGASRAAPRGDWPLRG